MTPEAEHFTAHCILKAFYKCKGKNHDRNTNSRSGRRQTDDEPGEGLIFLKYQSACYEGSNIQIVIFGWL